MKLDDQTHKVEVLNDGQQCVSHGPHPSGCVYEWERSPDLAIPRTWLPPLDQQTAIRFLKTLAGILPKLECVELRATGWDLTQLGNINFKARACTYQHQGDYPPPWRRYGAEAIAKLLDGKAHTEGGAGRWRCKCPAHRGLSHNSLSIEEIDAMVVWHCFAGCAQDDVARALVAAIP